MKPSNIYIFAFLIWPAVAEYIHMESGCRSSSGALSVLINKILESLRPNLANIYIRNKDFETGSQEFGNCRGNIRDVKLEGLDKFHIKTLRTNVLDITNLTIVENFIAKGLYTLNGSVAFPLGKNDIHLFGDGEFGAKITNSSISVKMKIRFENGKKIVRDLGLFVEFEKVEVYFKNLMGGSDLEKAFNQLINDITVSVFNYYKEPVLDKVKLELTNYLNNILNEKN